MDKVATPYQAINRKFLIAIGLWPHQTGFFKYLFLFNILFFTSTQCYFQTAGMITAWKDKDVFIESVPPVLVSLVCGAKIINFMLNFKKMKNLLVTLEKDWERIKKIEETKILNEYAILGRKFTLAYAACMYGSMAPFMIGPAVPIVVNFLGYGNGTQVKQLMFRVDYLMNVDKYYYFILVHSWLGTLAYITMVVAIDSILMTFVQHACAIFSILGYRLEHLTDGVDIDLDIFPLIDQDTGYQDMSDCISQHNHVLKYSGNIEAANFMSYFFQLGFNMVAISFTGFQMVMNLEMPSTAFRYAGFTMCTLVILFLQSYPAQMLYDHSIKVSEYAHNCGWYQTSLRTRRLVCLMTMRSRIPCELTAGKFYVLNLANFGAVIRTSMSYLTVLTSVK